MKGHGEFDLDWCIEWLMALSKDFVAEPEARPDWMEERLLRLIVRYRNSRSHIAEEQVEGARALALFAAEWLGLRLVLPFEETDAEALSTADAAGRSPSSRDRIINLIDFAECAFPGTSRQKTWKVLPLPPDLWDDLRIGLQALDAGEVQPIMKPAKGRHGDALTRDRAREVAVDHVAFLCGRRYSKKAARLRVSEATGIAVETLKAWEKRHQSKLRKDYAFRAGQLALARDEGEALPSNLSEVEPEMSAIWRRIEACPLDDFGIAFRALWGDQHWSN